LDAERAAERLSEERRAAEEARKARSFLVGNGISSTAVAMAGFGESQPVATNGTAAGRQRNRRVELIVSGEPIGRGR
jgi:outer membrane protein OmpA-like peptidoglycan-associated protein